MSATLFLVLSLSVQLQPPTVGCNILDRNQAPHYVTYERFGDGEADAKGANRHLVWLRFHNNTSCDVHLLGGRLSRGSVKDGDEWAVAYSIFLKDGRGPYCLECSDTQGVGTLPAGFSAVFSVLQRHFVVGEMIAVPVEYVWEDFWGIIGVGSRVVLFETGIIPEAGRRKFRK